MSSTPNSPEMPNIQTFVETHQSIFEPKEFLDLLKQANQAQDVLDTNPKLQTLNTMRLLESLWYSLLNTLEAKNLDDVYEPEKKTYQKDLKVLRKKFEAYLPNFVSAESTAIDLTKRLPHLNWRGNHAIFGSKDELGHIISLFCEELVKTNEKPIKFTIYLPQPSEHEREEAKNAPLARAHEFAKSVFAGAAKAGIYPKDLEIRIDNKLIAIQHDDFKTDMEAWNSSAAAAIKKKFQHARDLPEEKGPTFKP